MKKKRSSVKIMFFISTLYIILTFTSVVLAKEYSDLTSNHWAYEPINTMSSKGILNGYPDGSFKPDVAINRAEFAKIIVLTLNLNQKVNIKFEDVSEDYWANEYISVASNYLSAYKNGDRYIYKPEDAAAREDVAVAVVNAAGLNNSTYSLSTLDRFSDKDLISENLKKYVAIAIENGLMNGNANGTFNPKGNLTRAEVAQLMINSVNVLEKIAIYDEGIATKLPKFVYDADRGYIDLGENWENYKFSYSTSKQIGSIYTPSQRYLSYNQFNDVNALRESSKFCGNYAFVIDKNNSQNYVSIKITNPFKNVEYDRENGEIDLGSSWKKFEYGYTDSDLTQGSIYTPAQRTLTYSNYSEYDGDVQETFCGKYAYVYLETNHESYMRFTLSEPTAMPDFEYDEETGTIDLGRNWEKYKFSYSTSKQIGSIYTPAQRYLSYNQFNDVNDDRESSRFCGNYAFIIDKNDTQNYVSIKITSPFKNVKYDREHGQIDLGSNWRDFEYGYTDSDLTQGSIYTPAQRTLTYSNHSDYDSDVQETFCGKYAYVYLESNHESYMRFSLSEPTAMPEFEYDEETGTIDLGKNWEYYTFSYSTSKQIGTIYTPSQRYLSYNQFNDVNEYRESSRFCGNYAFVIDKNNSQRYATIKITSPFKNVKYDREHGQIDLGSNWEDFEYGYIDSDLTRGSIYTPAQRMLTYSNYSEYDGDIQETFCGKYAYVYLGANHESYMRFVLSEPTELPTFVYEKTTATIDLGPNWRNYSYSYSETKQPGLIYTPSQRYIGYNQHDSSYDGVRMSGFGGNYVFVMFANNVGKYTTVKVTNPFKDVKYDEATGQIDLGADWQNFKYGYTDSELGKGSIYTPAQRVLTQSNYSELDGDVQETFCGKYAYVYVKGNTRSYIRFELKAPTKMPAFYYNVITETLDLGAGWMGYKLGYSNKKLDGIPEDLWDPIYQMQDYSNIDPEYKYIYVVDKYNHDRYTCISVNRMVSGDM